jgi:hypothetical protein
MMEKLVECLTYYLIDDLIYEADWDVNNEWIWR